MPTAAELVTALGFAPHPEGGWYKETFRDRPAEGGRGTLTQIFYLLPAGEVSAWHRVNDATEVWHHYAVAPLVLSLSADGRTAVDHLLGPDVLAGQLPHLVMAPGVWQTARPAAGRRRSPRRIYHVSIREHARGC